MVISGAYGNMGREVVKAVMSEANMEVVGAVDPQGTGKDLGQVTGTGLTGVIIGDNMEIVLAETGPDVVVDFTTPLAVMSNIETILKNGVRAVVGTTGITQEDLEKVRRWTDTYGVGAFIAPNFALGAVLMMKFAEMAARYFPAVEIIELHHDKKLDAPSGTALKTAEMIRAAHREAGNSAAGEVPGEIEKIPGARGGNSNGIRVHSVRLPGLVAHQEVIFGGLGQVLTLRHDSINRQSFMPGVILAINRVMEINGLVYGLENLLNL